MLVPYLLDLEFISIRLLYLFSLLLRYLASYKT